MRIGLHARNTATFAEMDYQILQRAGIETLKAMSINSVASIEKAARGNEGLEVIVRLYDDRFGVNRQRPRAIEFVTRQLPIIESLRGLVTKFEIHNEPNHVDGIEGFGPTIQDAEAFAAWYDLVLSSLKSEAPWAEFGFPGLAPNWPHNDIMWLSYCREQIKASDWLGCHCYWQGENYNSLDWGHRHRLYHAAFPGKRIEITEFGDSTPGRSSADKAKIYAEWLQSLYKFGYIGSASAFIVSSPDPQWSGFVWAREDGTVLEYADTIGSVDWPASSINIVNITSELPKHVTERYNNRDLSQIKRIVIHHSATGTSSTPRQFANYHVDNLGWPGIGYHFVIAEDGTIYQTNELETISWHVKDNNTPSIGICLVGSFMGTVPTDEQITTTERLCQHLRGLLGWNVPVVGHKEVVATACPGNTWPDQWKIK